VGFTVEPGERPFLHPGRAASILAGDEQRLGWIGELHPLVAREWDLDGAAAFELDVDALADLVPARRLPAGLDVPRRDPGHRRRGADDVPAADVEDAVARGGGELLEQLRLFDVYRGEQVGEGSKSLALRLEFRAPDRTLTDDEVAEVRARSSRSSRAGREAAWLASPSWGVGLRRRAVRATRERHPRCELDVVTARSDAGRMLSDLYPRYRVDRKLESFDADRVAEAATPRSSRIRTARRRRRTRTCARAG
jgi:hypothetical protein